MNAINLYKDKLSEEDLRLVEQIEAAADATPPRDKGLAIHFSAIEKLRAKGYSYRDIAKWFEERGFKVSHVDVWRAHKNALDKEELFALVEHDEEWQEFVSRKSEGSGTVYTEKEFEADKAQRAAEPDKPVRKPKSK